VCLHEYSTNKPVFGQYNTQLFLNKSFACKQTVFRLDIRHFKAIENVSLYEHTRKINNGVLWHQTPNRGKTIHLKGQKRQYRQMAH
jgi:hypothetical protein